MKQIFYLFFLSFIATASSCEKESGPTTANGTVLDKTTNTPVADAEVGLFEKEPGLFANLGAELLQTKYSDANGKCSFDFIARKGYVYYLQAIKDQYFNDQSNNISYLHDTGGETDVTVYLQPEAFLQVHVIDKEPYFDNSEFRGNLYGGSIQIYGYMLDTTFIGKVYGNTDFQLYCVVENLTSHELEIFDNLIYCPAFDTTYFEISY